MITFEGVTKEYRSPHITKTILINYSSEWPTGRNIGLIGPNGAGKSTILRMISGTEAPDRGRIRRTGRISFPLGFAGSFKGSLSGRENCRFVARIYGLPTKAMEEFVEAFCQLGGYFDMPISTYSSGMRSRLAFGVSMGINFDCYLVDESLSVGDATFRARADAVLAERRKTTNIIMVSHSLSTLRQFCDMGFVLAGGTLVRFDNIEDAIEAYKGMVKRSGRRQARRHRRESE